MSTSLLSGSWVRVFYFEGEVQMLWVLVNGRVVLKPAESLTNQDHAAFYMTQNTGATLHTGQMYLFQDETQTYSLGTQAIASVIAGQMAPLELLPGAHALTLSMYTGQPATYTMQTECHQNIYQANQAVWVSSCQPASAWHVNPAAERLYVIQQVVEAIAERVEDPLELPVTKQWYQEWYVWVIFGLGLLLVILVVLAIWMSQQKP